MTVIDANGLIMGRLASNVAKMLLSGEEVSIVNAEQAVISGSKVTTFEAWAGDIHLRSKDNENSKSFIEREEVAFFLKGDATTRESSSIMHHV